MHRYTTLAVTVIATVVIAQQARAREELTEVVDDLLDWRAALEDHLRGTAAMQRQFADRDQ